MLRNVSTQARTPIYMAALVILSLFIWDSLFFSPNHNIPSTRIQRTDKELRPLLKNQSAEPIDDRRNAGADGSTRTDVHIDNLSLAVDFVARFFPSSFGLRWKNLLNRAEDIAPDQSNGKTEISPRSGYIHSIATCTGVQQHQGFSNACEFLQAHSECKPDNLVDYIRFFFCFCGKAPLLGYISLIVWLLALFYVLGNTAADYFCFSTEKLAKLLHLSPTVAGVTLLPFGNGAPDLFASIAAITGSGSGEVGFNSVLGGALFIVCVVAGSVILLLAGTYVNLDRSCFIRDASFFLVSLVMLSVILVLGKITFYGAMTYVNVYLLYAITVAAWECIKPQSWNTSIHILQPSSAQHCTRVYIGSPKQSERGGSYVLLQDPELGFPLLGSIAPPQVLGLLKRKFFSDQDKTLKQTKSTAFQNLHALYKLCEVLIEIPFALPRRLTIPTVEEDKWSRFYAVSSAILAPVLVACVFDTKSRVFSPGLLTSLGFCCGLILGIVAYFTTQAEHPPRKFAFAWVCGGFFMSLFWFYLIASELVAVLVSLGIIVEINPAVLALTLLAWGNCCGDLVANLALASNGGDDVQIAISACYAGPMFNTLMGLGLSLVFATWKAESGVYMLPNDSNLLLTVGFLVAALIWELLLLSSNNMQPTRVSGVGLMILYAIFLSLQVSSVVGLKFFQGCLAT